MQQDLDKIKNFSQETHVPQVSIGMPVYNGEKYLREALDSILAQTFTDFELIISDNASTDKTAEICAEYGQRDQRIKYHRQPENRGFFANAEFVINSSIGKSFMLVGDDDFYEGSFISTLLKILEENKSIGLAFSGFGYITPDGAKVPTIFNLHLTSTDSRFSGLIKFMFRRSALPMMMGLFRREVILKALPFVADELSPMTGDVDNVFLVSILSVCKSSNVKDPLFFYRLKDRNGGLPLAWPPNVSGQVYYIFKHHIRVVLLIQNVLRKSDFSPIHKALLMTINWISATWLFFRYSTSRLLKYAK